MSDPSDLGAFLDSAWQRLSRGGAYRRAPARHPGFATVSPDGLPQVRTVVLRAADRAASVLEVHTDTQSAKFVALRETPWAELHVWDARARLQLRLLSVVEIITGPDVDKHWESVPESARVSYGTEPAPGSEIAHVYDYEKPPNRDRFAVLRCQLQSMDLVHLDDRHRRAVFRREDGWQGAWLAP
ncbi:MAG: pyridoxamine 5'-phosphate oxidase family protein [Pseudomonadota bacterium]